MAADGAGRGRRAVVVGCGLGADSEHLARHGWRTTAFDISPAAVTAVRARYPDSPVDYREGNLLDLADDLVGAFDLVVEIYTLQALHPSLREPAVDGVRRLLAPGGTALVIQMVRRDDEPRTDQPPVDADPGGDGGRRRWRASSSSRSTRCCPRAGSTRCGGMRAHRR